MKIFPSLRLFVASFLILGGLISVASATESHRTGPADFGLREGQVISAAGSSDPDVYIVNAWGYKRLFLNPAIFNFYGHLGGFGAVTTVLPHARDAFITSGIFRNCETGDEKVYGLEVNAEDTGVLHWINISGAQAVQQDPDFFNKVFCINSREFAWYQLSPAQYTALAQVPLYSRTTAPLITPAPLSPYITYSDEVLLFTFPNRLTVTKDTYGPDDLRYTSYGLRDPANTFYKYGEIEILQSAQKISMVIEQTYEARLAGDAGYNPSYGPITKRRIGAYDYFISKTVGSSFTDYSAYVGDGTVGIQVGFSDVVASSVPEREAILQSLVVNVR